MSIRYRVLPRHPFNLDLHLVLNLSSWKVGLDWGAEWDYLGVPSRRSSKPEYRFFGVQVGPLDIIAFYHYPTPTVRASSSSSQNTPCAPC